MICFSADCFVAMCENLHIAPRNDGALSAAGFQTETVPKKGHSGPQTS
jgi:hypothetical protein